MGAYNSVYYSYTLGEPFDINSDIWEVCPVMRKEDEQEFTVFIHDKEKKNERVDNAVKYSRTLRHPGLLKCHELFDDQSDEIAMVTEAVVPLAHVITDLHINEVIAGIHNVVVTLAFLHDKCQLSHNNLSMDSIFVGQNDACWKIAEFENMCPFSEIAKEKLMNESLAHAKDILGLGKLICDILEQIDAPDDKSVSNFHQRIQTEVVEASVEKRPKVRSLLDDEIFQNEYCQILDFLQNITVKTSSAKSSFFRTLHVRLHEVPCHLIANRLLHLLLSRFVLVDPTAVEIFLPHILTPLSEGNSTKKHVSPNIQSLLPQDLYRERCIPIIRKLFEVNDRHVRLILLRYFHLYVSMFDKNILQSVILPELRLGLQDSDDELVSATFSALQYLVPLIGANVVIGGERLSQFTERRPKFTQAVKALSSGSEMPSVKVEPSHFITPTVKSIQSKSLEDKIEERERRREETKRRNEEKRKQRQKLQMERKMAAVKSVNVTEPLQEESGDEFNSWDNFESQEKQDRGEISDDSEHGRPSSSEISLDSGFSERPRNITEHLANKQTLHENRTEDLNKHPKGKTSFGMKLGKGKQESSSVDNDERKMTLKDLAKTTHENKLSSHKLENNDKDVLRTSETSFKTNTRGSSFSMEKYEETSNEFEDNFTTNFNDFSPGSLSARNDTKMSGKKKLLKKNSGPKLSKTERLSGSKSPDKNKTGTPQKMVDKSWDEFDIKIKKKDIVMDDIFADMAPVLLETRKAPVKGTSMYSDKLAVVTNTSSEDADGWMNDDW